MAAAACTGGVLKITGNDFSILLSSSEPDDLYVSRECDSHWSQSGFGFLAPGRQARVRVKQSTYRPMPGGSALAGREMREPTFAPSSVISIRPAPTSLATTTVVRVGRGSLKNFLYTAFIASNVDTSVRYTWTLTRTFSAVMFAALENGVDVLERLLHLVVEIPGGSCRPCLRRPCRTRTVCRRPRCRDSRRRSALASRLNDFLSDPNIAAAARDDNVARTNVFLMGCSPARVDSAEAPGFYYFRGSAPEWRHRTQVAGMLNDDRIVRCALNRSSCTRDSLSLACPQ